MKKQLSPSLRISVIGVRGFPAEFIGTSGLEVYVEKTIRELLRLSPNLHFLIYTRRHYQPRRALLPERVKIKILISLHSKVLESAVYSFIASINSALDSSKIVWYQGVGPGLFFFIPRVFGKKVFLTVHALDWERKKWNSLERFLFRLGASFVFFLKPNAFTVSRDLKKFLARKFDIDAIYAPPGIELLKTEPSVSYLKKYNLEASSYFLFLGRLVPEKRIEWLIEEYLKLINKFPKLKLVIAGGHGNLPKYEKKLKDKYKGRGIVWLGYIFGEEKLSFLCYCRCFVLPSELEGNPVSFMEVLGMGKPSIVSGDVAGDFKELGNVFVFRGDEKESFRETLKKALTLGRKYHYKIGELEKIKRFSWRRTSEEYNLRIIGSF